MAPLFFLEDHSLTDARFEKRDSSVGGFQGASLLDVPAGSEERRVLRDWRFLEEFRADSGADLTFDIDILRQPWSDGAREKIMKPSSLNCASLQG